MQPFGHAKGVGAVTGADGRAEFAAFMTAALPGLLRYGRMLTGNAAAAEELVQDALVRTYQRWDRLVSRDDPYAYVRRTMVNAHISGWRRWGARIHLGNVAERSAADPGLVRIEDDELRQALDRLPPRQRAVLVLRYFDDLSEADAARALGCSVGTVKSQSSRAIATLRQAVANQPVGS
jgi:RNA polymerase sigma-70 factor (sigma-E family)